MSINERPEFASAVRGYDRQQVDDYVQVLLQYIEELNRRAMAAEEAAHRRRDPQRGTPPPPPPEPAAERALHAVLAQVADEARAITESARTQADQARAAARNEADEILRAARSDAALLLASAQSKAGGAAPARQVATPQASDGAAAERPVLEASMSYRDDAGGEHALSLSAGKRYSIGRAPGCDIQLTWDDCVSRRHAHLERVADDSVLIDDGTSSNGTFVNEQRLTGKRRLSDGDVVRTGETRLTFHERRRGFVGTAKPAPAQAGAAV